MYKKMHTSKNDLKWLHNFVLDFDNFTEKNENAMK